uniref:Uncharacterized protein n=1 Tax=Avena sativa TaxID=4498 RepID=A0ACD5XKV5_AVESA
MEPEMEIIQVEDSGDDHLSLEASHDSDVSLDDRPIAPSIGSQYQAEIPNLATEDERRHLMASPLYSCKSHVYDDPSSTGSAIPIIWGSHPPSEVNKKENITSECDLPYLDPHAVLSVDQTESVSNPVCGEKTVLCFTRKCRGLFTDKTMVHQRETEKNASLPGLSASVWNDLEEECFLLGLHIFGKNLILLSKFVGSKTIGDMLSYYYGKFYNGDAYKRWSHCRKTRTTRCILGKSIFTGRRQLEIISRLKSKLFKESHDSVVEVLKSFSDDLTSLEECVFTLKSTIGPEIFVEVVGIGKGKHDLTGFVKDTSKTNKGLYGSANMAKGINCSTLATEDIIKFLTGGFRRSKAKSNDLFWEAVWPRLLARGWHSEQPKDVRTAKNCLVFIVPGIKKFSRKKLAKGTHYFDSTTDVLKKVATDPSLLELEIVGTDNGVTAHKNARTASQDGPLNGDPELLMFTVIDTSLVQGEGHLKVRVLRSLPDDANISSGPAQYSDDMSCHSSSQEQDSDDIMSADPEYHRGVTAPVKNIEMESVYGTTSLVNLLRNMETAPQSVFPVNGHSSDDQHSDISNGNGDEVDVACISALGTKTGRRVYLSPKRRRFARRSNDHTNRRSFCSRNVDDLERNKLKSLSNSFKPTVVDLGGSFQTRTLENCSTKEIADVVNSATNAMSLNVVNINEDKSSEGKIQTVGGASMGTSPENHNYQWHVAECEEIADVVKSATNGMPLNVVNRDDDKSSSEGKIQTVGVASMGTSPENHNYQWHVAECEEIADVVKSATNGMSLNVVNIDDDKSSSEGKIQTVGVASMGTSPENHNYQWHVAECEEIADVVKSAATNGMSLNVVNIDDDKSSSEGKIQTVGRASMGTWPENHNCLQKNEDVAPSISSSEIVPDVLEAAGKHDLTVQPRHGTRTRAPTAKALEAVALGLLGGAKRKGGPGSLTTRRPPQRVRKNKD